MSFHVKGHFFRSYAGDKGEVATSNILIPLTGIAVLECSATYKGSEYSAGESIPVERGENLNVHHTIGDNNFESFELNINDGEFTAYWSVIKRFYRLLLRDEEAIVNGTTYGTLKNITQGNDYSFIESDTVIDSTRDQVVLDKKNNEAWVFGIGTVKVTCPSDIVDAVSTPRWSSSEVPAKTYIVCKDHVIEYANGEVVGTKPLPFPALSASGGTDNRIVILGGNVLYYFDYDSGNHELIHKQGHESNQFTTGGGLFSNNVTLSFGYVFVAPDGSIVIAKDDDSSGFVVSYVTEEGRGAYNVYLGTRTKVSKVDITSDFIFTIDPSQNALNRISTGDRSVATINFFNSPSGMVVNESDGNVWVSFYDSSEVKVYSPQFELVETIDTGITNNGITFSNGDVFVTDIYSDAEDVSKFIHDDTSQPSVNGYVNSARGFINQLPRTQDTVLASDYWSYSFPSAFIVGRPEYLYSDPREATVLINGSPFTEGWVRQGDTYDIIFNGINLYATDYNSQLIGSGNYSSRGPTELKLFPDLVVLPQLNGAQLNNYYYESYTVEGITQGEIATLNSSGSVLEFLVNWDEELDSYELDAMEFVTEGNVENGDRVLVRAKIKNLFPRREPYSIYSEGNIVVNWVILPMLLEGTTVRKRSTQEIDRSAHIWLEHNRQEAVHEVETVAALNEYSAFLTYSMMDSVVSESNDLRYDGMSSHEMNGPTVSYYGNTFEQLEVPVKVMYTDQAFANYISSKTSDINSNEFERNVKLVTFFDNSVFGSYETNSTVLNIAHVYEKSLYGDNKTVIDAAYIQNVQALARFIPMPVRFYARRAFNDPVYHTNLFVRFKHLDKFFLSGNFFKETENFNFFGVSFKHVRYESSVYFSHSYGVRLLASHLNFVNTPQRLYIGKPYTLDAPLFELLRTSVFSKFLLDPSKLELGSSVQFSLNASKTIYSVNKVNANAFEFLGNTSKFAGNAQRDGFGGFETEIQAIAYAESLGFEPSNYVTKQVEGGWFFLTNINNTDLVCTIGEGNTDPENKRKFGYIHGG